MINTSRSERGWRGRRRIAVLVSIAGVLGLIAVGSATTASATTVANCKAKLAPKGSVSGNISFGKVSYGKLSFTCDSPIRTYSIAGNKKIKNYSAPNAGSRQLLLQLRGERCRLRLRCCQPIGTRHADPQGPRAGQHLYRLTRPAAASSTATPTHLQWLQAGPGRRHRRQRAEPERDRDRPVHAGDRGGHQGDPGHQAGCKPVQGQGQIPAEPARRRGACGDIVHRASQYRDPGPDRSGGDSATVGEYLQAPTPVNLKAYKACQAPIAGAKKASKSSATKSVIPATKFPVSCTGGISPASTPGDSSVSFSCTQNIRAFAIYSNNPIDLPGDEPVVTGSAGGGLNESAIHQCEGSIPGPGYGCGTVDRQVQTAPPPAGTGLINGNGISAGNIATQKMGFEKPPCKGSGTKAWLVVMGEPVIDGVVGEFNSAPFPLRISGFGKCKGGKKK